MKNVLYLLLAFLILGCEQEDKLTPKLEIENLYCLQDDPSDSIKHRVFEIYQNYGVPVYFNDTIGQVFLKNDVNGKAVYRYETLDLAWKYTKYDEVTFEYEYMTDPDEQSKILGSIETYLKSVPKALYPFNFFITKSVKMTDASDNEENYGFGSFLIHFRTTTITGDWGENIAANFLETLKRGMLQSKITNYKDLLTEFNNISEEAWYGKSWIRLDSIYFNSNYFDYIDNHPNYMVAHQRGEFYPSAFSDTWWGVDDPNIPEDEFRAAIRAKIGQFGFVGGSSISKQVDSPATTNEDLVLFIKELLQYSREEFEELWGTCPLVMEKYEILYDVITNKIGVEL